MHVFTHMLGAVHGQAPPHVTVDGHTHGPLDAYFNCLTPSTAATMSKALTSALSSGRLGCNCEIAFTGAPSTNFNLLTTARTSRDSGCVVIDGGLKLDAASP